jgi:hypothetical protein
MAAERLDGQFRTTQRVLGDRLTVDGTRDGAAYALIRERAPGTVERELCVRGLEGMPYRDIAQLPVLLGP